MSGQFPKGFSLGSTNVGIKSQSDQPDLVLVSSNVPASGVAIFTRNQFLAASVTISQKLMAETKGRGLRGIIANSGCANLSTGQSGLNDSRLMSEETAKYISTSKDSKSPVLVMHTGAGGQRYVSLRIAQSLSVRLNI